MEFEDIREALDALFGVNDRRTTSRVKDTETSLWRDQTIDDLKEFNLGALTYIADTLGMSDLYLSRERWKKEQKKSPASEETGHNMKKLELKTEKNNVPMTNWSRVIIETAESNPKLIAIVTNDDFELANGFRVRLQPIYKD